MDYTSIEELLESEHAETIRVRNSVAWFNVVGLMFCTSAFMIYHTVWYVMGGIGFVSFVTGAIAVGLCMPVPINWTINRYHPDLWYRMRTRRVVKHLNADERKLYLEHIQNLKSIRKRHKKNKILRRRIDFLP